LIDNTKILLIK